MLILQDWVVMIGRDWASQQDRGRHCVGVGMSPRSDRIGQDFLKLVEVIMGMCLSMGGVRAGTGKMIQTEQPNEGVYNCDTDGDCHQV